MNCPYISIITITLNSEKYLEQTILSVINQSYKNIEYIIVDGGSTDATIKIINKYQCQISHWISEPDCGIADAMNKGLSYVTGDYILFLHSDDYLIDKEIINRAAAYIKSQPEYEILLFNILLESNGQQYMKKPRGLGWWMNFKTGVFHQSAICKRVLFDKIGSFDTQFKVAMDYDFFLRASKIKTNFISIDLVLSVMRLSGVSSRTDWRSLQIRFDEERRTHYKNLDTNKIILWLIYNAYWSFYIPYRKFIHELNSKK